MVSEIVQFCTSMQRGTEVSQEVIGRSEYGVPESGEATLTGRSGVHHNGDNEKNGDANQVERDVSAFTEG